MVMQVDENAATK